MYPYMYIVYDSTASKSFLLIRIFLSRSKLYSIIPYTQFEGGETTTPIHQLVNRLKSASQILLTHEYGGCLDFDHDGMTDGSRRVS